MNDASRARTQPKLRKSHEQWLSEDDENQWEWVMNYLISNNLRSSPFEYGENAYAIVLQKLNEIPLDEKGISVIKEMRKTWSKVKYRSNPDHKTFNIVLSQNASEQLKRLIKKQPINKTIEDLITYGSQLKQNYDKELKATKKAYDEKIDAHKKHLEKQYIAKDYKFWRDIVESQINKEKILIEIELRALRVKVYGLLYELALYKTQIQEQAIPLTPEASKRAEELAQQYRRELLPENALCEIERLIEKTPPIKYIAPNVEETTSPEKEDNQSLESSE